MKIDAGWVKSLRTERHWSQEQLATACGLNLRTIQRLENTGKASMESVRALAAVFEVTADELILKSREASAGPLDAVRAGVLKATDFSGTASRFDYWWFLLFVLLAAAVASVISARLLQIFSILVLLPLLAVGTRRLRDAGHSGWWQLMLLVPFGQVVVLMLLALRGQSEGGQASPSQARTV